MRPADIGKDLFYRYVPLQLARHVLPILPGTSPYGEKIVETEAIFIHVPKAAGSSVKTELYGGPRYGHRRIAEFYAYDPTRAASFFKLGFVRNPWDRLLSAWSFLSQGGANRRDRLFAQTHLHAGDFGTFVAALEERRYARRVLRYEHFRPQTHWICRPGQPRHALDFLGRFERFEDDMAEIRSRLNLPARPRSVRIRTSEHLFYRDAYTTRMRDVVAELYAEDIGLLDYRF